ncbi:hypothetical protein [Porphyromonas sp.]
MYPTLLKAIFNVGMEEYNDYNRGILKVTNRPFEFLKIPATDIPEKRSVDIGSLRRFFIFTPQSGQATYTQEQPSYTALEIKDSSASASTASSSPTHQ